MKYITTFFSTFFIILILNAQNSTDSILLNRNFKFNDGLFINFNEVSQNKPITKNNIVSDLDKSNYNFFEILLEKKEITIIDENGTQKTFKSEEVWGYSQDGKLYINYKSRPAIVPYLGNICHFIGTEIVYENSSNDNFGLYNPTSGRLESVQMILDFSTGEIYEFGIRQIDPIFARDIELYKEWTELSKGRKKKLIFVYIQKYNERNPVYFIKQ